MNKLIFILLLSISLSSYGQITKITEITNRAWGLDKLNALYQYDEEDNLKNIQILYLGTDERFRQSEVFKYDTIFVGSPKEFINHVDQIISFYEGYDPEVSRQINGHTVLITRYAGMKALFLYDKKGEAFSAARINLIRRMRKDFVEWAAEARVDYM